MNFPRELRGGGIFRSFSYDHHNVCFTSDRIDSFHSLQFVHTMRPIENVHSEHLYRSTIKLAAQKLLMRSWIRCLPWLRVFLFEYTFALTKRIFCFVFFSGFGVLVDVPRVLTDFDTFTWRGIGSLSDAPSGTRYRFQFTSSGNR